MKANRQIAVHLSGGPAERNDPYSFVLRALCFVTVQVVCTVANCHLVLPMLAFLGSSDYSWI